MLTMASFSRRFALPLWRWYLVGFVALALTNIITLEIPQLAKTIINALSAPAADRAVDLPWVALAIAGLGLLTILIRGLSRIFIFWPGRKLEAASKTVFFGRILRLPETFYEKFGMGELISRLANDIGQLRAFFAFGVLQVLNLACLLVFTISKMLSVHPTLTMVCLAPIFLMVIIMRPMMTYMHKISLANQQATGRLTNRVTEAFINVHVIQANAATAAFSQRTEKENEDVYVTNMQAVVMRTVLFPLLAALMSVSQATVLFYGGYEVMQGRLTVGDILAFNVYIAYLGFPLSSIGIILSLYQRSQTALQRLSEIEDTKAEGALTAAATAPPAGASAALLEVRGLNFAYPSSAGHSGGFALADISFRIARGERLGLFGAIGCGKSTLLNLIARLAEPPPGTVFFAGRDVLSYSPQELRREIGYAQQTVHLFSDSIRGNLLLGVEDVVDEQRMVEAARGSQILAEIEGFEQGWETPIGERGIRLSGGQKQRLALARLFIRQPPLLLLDDVLSAVDQKTERRLVEYIHQAKSAVMIASHRLTALRDCHEILVFDNGRIADRGTFAELKRRHKIFHDDEHAHG